MLLAFYITLAFLMLFWRSGHPIFFGRVTAWSNLSINAHTKSEKPIFKVYAS